MFLLKKIIKKLADAGKSDAITSIFVCPSIFVSASRPEDNPLGYEAVESGTNVERESWVNTFGIDDSENYKPTDLDGYKPKNNKLFTYPYCYMLMNNNSGGTAIYKYELFNNPDDDKHCAFYIYSSVTPGMSITIAPRYYNGVNENVDENLLTKYKNNISWNTRYISLTFCCFYAPPASRFRSEACSCRPSSLQARSCR